MFSTSSFGPVLPQKTHDFVSTWALVPSTYPICNLDFSPFPHRWFRVRLLVQSSQKPHNVSRTMFLVPAMSLLNRILPRRHIASSSHSFQSSTMISCYLSFSPIPPPPQKTHNVSRTMFLASAMPSYILFHSSKPLSQCPIHKTFQLFQSPDIATSAHTFSPTPLQPYIFIPTLSHLHSSNMYRFYSSTPSSAFEKCRGEKERGRIQGVYIPKIVRKRLGRGAKHVTSRFEKRLRM